MSEMEYNKGKITLVSSQPEKFAKQWLEASEEYSSKDGWDDIEWFMDVGGWPKYAHNYQVIGDKMYFVEWEVRAGEFDYCNNLKQAGEGVYEFETYHYNGGGDWVELVEENLEKEVKQQEED